MPILGYWTRRELWSEIDRLRAENAELRHADSRGSASLSRFPGRTEMALRVDASNLVVHVTGDLAKCVGRPVASLKGSPLAELDAFEWGAGLLAAMAGRARETGRAVTEQRDFFLDGKDRCYLIRATPVGGEVSLVLQDFTEHRGMERAFGRRVAPAVLERMRAAGGHLLRPERARLSILFADLRGFTPLAATMPADLLVEMLSDVLSQQVAVLMGTVEATVDKFLGDGLMAYFGHPAPGADHASRAVRAAVAMQEAHRKTRAAWAARGQAVPALGVGVATGEVVVGEVGPPERTDYTAIGPAVNLAARICGVAGPGEVWVDAETRRQAEAAGLVATWSERRAPLKGLGEVALHVWCAPVGV